MSGGICIINKQIRYDTYIGRADISRIRDHGLPPNEARLASAPNPFTRGQPGQPRIRLGNIPGHEYTNKIFQVDNMAKSNRLIRGKLNYINWRFARTHKSSIVVDDKQSLVRFSESNSSTDMKSRVAIKADLGKAYHQEDHSIR